MSSSDLPANERRRSWIIILLVLLFICGCLVLAIGPGRDLIENVLGGSLFFPSGDGKPTETVTCGDGKCDPAAEEDCVTCPKDCGECPPDCGDGRCNEDAGENCTSCPKDCGECPPDCGDGRCNEDAGEDCNSCPKDCGECPPDCGDGRCNEDAGEDCDSCPKDCGECPPACGDGECDKDAGEDCKTCEKDCGACPVVNPRGACLDPCDPANSTCQAGLACIPEATGSNQYICWNQEICEGPSVPPCNNNGVCESGETGDCPDCQQAPCVCGDGVCEQYRCNELQQNCPADCGSGPGPDPCAGSYCGDGVCRPECGEDYWNCNAYYGGDCN